MAAPPAEELTLYSARPSTFLLLGVFVGFTSFMVWGIVRLPWPGNLLFWFGLLLFGSFTLAALLLCIPGTSYLRLTADGFAMHFACWSTFRRWDEVVTFTGRQVYVGGGSLFTFPVAEVSYRLADAHLLAQKGKHEEKLPDGYGMTGEALARLLTEWKTRHAPAS